jgi:hypothetical protein
MAKHTHLVVAYNHDTKTFWFDGDGSREWIRRLFTPETNTWSDEEEEFIPEDLGLVADAMTALEALNIEIDETDGWLTR